MVYLLAWICFGIACAKIAASKGRDAVGWFFLGALLGPFGLIFALLAGKEGAAKGERKCPFCAEFIKAEARVCKHCGRDLVAQDDQEDDQEDEENQRDVASRWVIMKDSGKTCGRCGTPNKMSATACKRCGWKPGY